MAPAEVDTYHRSVRCVVKLGGAAVTHKNEFERIDDIALSETASQLRDALGLCCSTHLSMDWSLGSGLEDGELLQDDGRGAVDMPQFIVVHGAGSFGHFQASRARVNLGGIQSSFVKAGFVATRISVWPPGTTDVFACCTQVPVPSYLANAVAEGIPAVAISPFAGGWSTAGANLEYENSAYVKRVLDTGLVPVLHGDAVFDSTQGCRILSGDIIVRHLAHTFKPNYVVFLTNVPGVFDRPPELPGAVLLKEIVVKDGSWTIIDPPLAGVNVETSVAAHDTTGGMAAKIAEAASIASAGISVFVVKAGSRHALEALKGTVRCNKEDWVGTIIRHCNA